MNNNQAKEQFTGKIIYRKRKKVYDKKSPFYQQVYYKLIVETHTFIQEEQKLFVYPNIVSSETWTIIESRAYLCKKYNFTVQRSKWGWILLDCQEINSYNYL